MNYTTWISRFRFIALVLCSCISTFGYSFGTPKHSTVKASILPLKDGTTHLRFELIPNHDMKVTLDAPWLLKIVKVVNKKGHKALLLKQSLFTAADMDKSIPGFDVQVSSSNSVLVPKTVPKTVSKKIALATKSVPTTKSPSGNLDYELTSFVCTKDKTRCFREVHKLNLKW